MTTGGADPRQFEAIFFDVDFTLIYPGPTFQGEGYARFCAADGLAVDASRFDAAVAAASFILDEVEEPFYDDNLFIHYTATIIEHMGGRGPQVMNVARHVYEQWATNHHFELYEDVVPALNDLARRGFKLGVISNSHRALDTFCAHFCLGDVLTTTVSSAEHGYMKPHPSIFEAALAKAGASAAYSLMVGDSVKADIEGALSAGMGAVLLRRSGEMPGNLPDGVAVIQTLFDLPDLVGDCKPTT